MQKQLLFLLLFLATAGMSAQVLEDFEGGVADLPWEAVDGTYDGPVMNPNDTTSNASEWVGSYTKSGTNAFSLFRAVLDAPLDLTTNNLFTLQVSAGAATELIFKLEGPSGGFERRVNIATAEVWRTYSFDMSPLAGNDDINTITLFFDPGEEESADTYLFDNLKANPAGPCAGTVAEETIIDDFECQRNAAYRGGFDDISVIANPDPSGINTSDSVGRYEDQMGGFAALVVNYDDGLDLSVNNQICIDVWAPVAGNLLIKLEGGVSPSVEIPNQVDQTMEWVQVCVDFSGQAAANHNQITFFFNAGENGEGDIYFIDNITRTPAPPVEALEDFEDGANLGWMPLNGNTTVNGTFNGVIANPDMMGNMSANVGSYTRAGTNFSTLTAILPDGIDLSGNAQINLDVWAPAGATEVTMQLVSDLNGPSNVTVAIPATMSWQTLNFSFEADEDVTDFGQINLLFSPGTMGTGTYFFDNLAQGSVTVDACADVETDASVLDDFECQRNTNYTCCSAPPAVVANPDVSPANISLTVGEFIDPPGAFNALVLNNEVPFDLSQNNQFSADIWSPVGGQILFKLEGGTSPDREIFVDVVSTEEWVNYSVDYSDAAGGGYTRLVLFFGAGTDNATANTYYIDNIEVNRAPFVTSCVTTFENEDITIENWRYFANGDFDGTAFTIGDNPTIDAVNGSTSVGVFQEATNGEIFAGLTGDPVSPITLNADNMTITAKILMPVEGRVALKLERGRDGAAGSGDVFADYTTPGQWQELTWDYSASGVEPGAAYDGITIIPNFDVVPTEVLTHYFDDIAVGGGMCGTVGLFNPVVIDDLKVFPNPVSGTLTIENANDARRFTVTNLLGQQMDLLNVAPGGGAQVQWNLNHLPSATYVLTATANNGQVVARSLFVKQ